MTTAVSRLAFAIAAALVAGGAGCAKDSTAVTVAVTADATVPPILILRTALARAADPTRRVSSDRSSPYGSDAGDRPGPFEFPLSLLVTVDGSFAGPVVVTVEGVDWDSGVVIARGEGPAEVVAQQTTEAALALTAVASAGGGSASP
jgi:hypothetical protein